MPPSVGFPNFKSRKDARFQPLLVPLVWHSYFGPNHELYCGSSDSQKEKTLMSGEGMGSRQGPSKMRNVVKTFEFGFGWYY